MKSIPVSAKFNLEQVIIGIVVSLAWSIAVVDSFIAKEHFFDYHILLHAHAFPSLLQLLLLIISWQFMTIAMMLPSNLPLIKLFAKVSSLQPKPVFYLSLLALILAYLSIWTGFAFLAFFTAAGLHWLLNNFSGLEGNFWLISGVTLLIAGGFQFSDLKQRCLKVCRHPLSFLNHHYQRGIKASWNLGINHGLYCLGCCWALMLLMFVTGVGHLAIMLLLTGIMTIEKTFSWGQTLVPIVGIALIASGLVTLTLGGVSLIN